MCNSKRDNTKSCMLPTVLNSIELSYCQTLEKHNLLLKVGVLTRTVEINPETSLTETQVKFMVTHCL